MLLRLLLLLSPLATIAQGDLIAEWQKQYDAWFWKSPRAKVESPRWSASGRTLAYGWLGKDGLEWRLVDCESGRSRPAFARSLLSRGYMKTPPRMRMRWASATSEAIQRMLKSLPRGPAFPARHSST